MKIQPLYDRVIVKRLLEETQTSSGIVIPDSAQEKPSRGVIEFVGEGKWNENGDKRIPLSVKKGDTVLFGQYAGQEISIEGEKVFVMNESDIMAVIG